MLGRRKFLGAVGATTVALVGARQLGDLGNKPGEAPPSALGANLPAQRQAAIQLNDVGLAPTARFHTAEVQSLDTTPDGAVSVRLADSTGQSFDVLLLSHDARTPGVARAGSLGVYMRNNGDGSTATVEEHGLAAMALARHLARREATGARLPVLPTLSQRSTTARSAIA